MFKKIAACFAILCFLFTCGCAKESKLLPYVSELREALYEGSSFLGRTVNVLSATDLTNTANGYVLKEDNNLTTYRQKLIASYSPAPLSFLPELDYNWVLNRYTHDGVTLIGVASKTVDLITDNSYYRASPESVKMSTWTYESYELNIKGSRQKSTYENNYNEAFLYDLALIGNGLTIDEFFVRFGTHLIGKAVIGAKFECIYALSTNENGAEIMPAANKTQSVFLGKKCHPFYISACGGDTHPFMLASDLDAEFSKWKDTLCDDNLVFLGARDGLVPIWEILPEEYSELAVKMESRFNERYQELYYRYSDKCMAIRDEYENSIKDSNEEVYQPPVISDSNVQPAKDGRKNHAVLWGVCGGVAAVALATVIGIVIYKKKKAN